MTFAFYQDPALTDPVTPDKPIALFERVTPAADTGIDVTYFGSPQSGLQAHSVQVQLVAATPLEPGAVHPLTDYRLALSEAGLQTATPGAPLDLPDPVDGGTGGAILIYIGSDDSTAASGRRSDVKLFAGGFLVMDA